MGVGGSVAVGRKKGEISSRSILGNLSIHPLLFMMWIRLCLNLHFCLRSVSFSIQLETVSGLDKIDSARLEAILKSFGAQAPTIVS